MKNLKFYVFGARYTEVETMEEAIDLFNKTVSENSANYKAIGLTFRREDSNMPSSIDLVGSNGNNIRHIKDYKAMKYGENVTLEIEEIANSLELVYCI